jgi:hypothetical protein
MKTKLFPALLALATPICLSRSAFSQAAPSGGAAPAGTNGGATATGGSPPPAGGPVAPPSGPTIIYTTPYGVPNGPMTNPNTYLPSSSQPSTTPAAPPTTSTCAEQGGTDAARQRQRAVLDPGHIETAEPLTPIYTVKRGDTLWELCDRYFHNPWDWPRIWSYNPELQNPHWIYPGDQIRMQSATEVVQVGPAGAPRQLGTGIRFVGRQSKVKPNTIFLRDQGYIDDDVKDVWGEVSGSPEDQLLLSDGDNAYLEIKPGHEVRVGGRPSSAPCMARCAATPRGPSSPSSAPRGSKSGTRKSAWHAPSSWSRST